MTGDINFPLAGSINLALCETCESSVGQFVLEAESDAADLGLVTGGICNQLDVVVGWLAPEDWEEFLVSVSPNLPDILASNAGPGDYRVLHVLRIDAPEAPPPGLSFQDFRKLYRPPVVVYRCPCCGTGEAKATEIMMDDFLGRGGRIRLVEASHSAKT